LGTFKWAISCSATYWNRSKYIPAREMAQARELALIGHCPALLECGEYALLVMEASKAMPYRQAWHRTLNS